MHNKQMEQKIINKMLALLGVCGVLLCSCEARWDVEDGARMGATTGSVVQGWVRS